MGKKDVCKSFYGEILGYIETKDNGDQVATNFYGKILGYYRKDQDHTTDFYGRIICKGNMVMSLIYKQ